MKEATPLVSVLMPVYNGMPYLPMAVESILNQSFKDFELIIVDDCSTDDSLQYLKTIKDKRLNLISLQQNKGVTGALREGMARVRGKYIARLDADDIALSERLQVQIDFLDTNPKYGLVGSSVSTMDSAGVILSQNSRGVDDLEIRWKMLFKNPFVHSTVVFRKSIIDSFGLNYAEPHAEDYHLWNDMIQHTKGCILKDLLVQYRIHDKSWTTTKSDKQSNARKGLSFKLVNQIFSESGSNLFTEDDYTNLINWRKKGTSISKAHLEISLLDAFSLVYSDNSQLPFLKKNVLKKIWRRLNGKIFINPLLGVRLIKRMIL